MNSYMSLINNRPLDDFLGLSPNEMHHLLFFPFTDKSPIKLKQNISDDVLNRIPFFRLTEEFLKIVQREKSIKLTPLGALPRKVLVELYDFGFIKDTFIEKGYSKINREIDAPAIGMMNVNTQLAGFVKKSANKISLTKTAEKHLEKQQRNELFEKVFKTFTTKINWGLLDGYSEYQIVQTGWGFSLFLLSKLSTGQEQSILVFSEPFVNAYVKELNAHSYEFGSPLRAFTNCYELRTFEHFFRYFGFIEITQEMNMVEKYIKIKATGLHKDVVEFDV